MGMPTFPFFHSLLTLCFRLIYGLISKEECSAVLSKHKEGTFLIRFSESIPGAFAIAYLFYIICVFIFIFNPQQDSQLTKQDQIK